MQAPPRILVVDAHPAVRRGLALVLEAANVGTCIEAGCAEEALELARDARPDLALIEMSSTPRAAFALLGYLRAMGIPVLIRSRDANCPADEALAAHRHDPLPADPVANTIVRVLRARVEGWLLVGRTTTVKFDGVNAAPGVVGDTRVDGAQETTA